MELNNENFQLDLLFEGDKNPVEAFNEMKDIFQSFLFLDNVFLSSIDAEIRVDYSIQHLEFSSIKTWIAQRIKEVPDDAIKELDWKKLVGHFLLKLKYLILRFLENNTIIDGKDSLEKLSKDIEREKHKLLNDKGYIINEVSYYQLINAIDQIVVAVGKLKNNEKVRYKSVDGSAVITNQISINKAKVLWELGDTISANETTETLKVKRVDFLSNNPTWSFKLGVKSIEARIIDQEWLNKYHSRDYPLLPEDSLKVKLRVVYTSNKDGKVTKPTYEIVKVIDIIYPDSKPDTFF